jgi:hypothetical protein
MRGLPSIAHAIIRRGHLAPEFDHVSELSKVADSYHAATLLVRVGFVCYPSVHDLAHRQDFIDAPNSRDQTCRRSARGSTEREFLRSMIRVRCFSNHNWKPYRRGTAADKTVRRAGRGFIAALTEPPTPGRVNRYPG